MAVASPSAGQSSPGLAWQHRDTLALAIVTLGALVARLWSIGSESVWLDEATSIWLAGMPLREMVPWTAVDIHPPLYYAVLHAWLVLGEGEAQTRLFSALCGVASVAVLYMIVWRLAGTWTAIAAAALLATSPLHVWYSQQVRMYALLTLLALVSSYCMLRAVLDGRRWAWPAYGIFAVAMLYTHYYAFFVLLFQNVFALYLLWRRCISPAIWRRWLAAQALAALAFLPWLPTMIRQVQSGGGGWVARTGEPGVDSLVATVINYTLGSDLRWYAPWLRRVAYVLFGGLAVAGVLSAWRTRRGGLLVAFGLCYLVAPLGVAWLVSQVKPLYSVRYLLPFLPAYYILIGQGATALPRLAGAVGRVASFIVVALALAIGCVGVAGSALHEQEDDWRGVAQHILAAARSDDIVLFVPGWNEKPFAYYARGRVATEGDTPIPIAAEAVPALVTNVAAGRQRLWLVYAEGHYADPSGSLRTYLDGAYDVEQQQRFRDGISVSLYNLGP